VCISVCVCVCVCSVSQPQRQFPEVSRSRRLISASSKTNAEIKGQNRGSVPAQSRGMGGEVVRFLVIPSQTIPSSLSLSLSLSLDGIARERCVSMIFCPAGQRYRLCPSTVRSISDAYLPSTNETSEGLQKGREREDTRIRKQEVGGESARNCAPRLCPRFGIPVGCRLVSRALYLHASRLVMHPVVTTSYLILAEPPCRGWRPATARSAQLFLFLGLSRHSSSRTCARSPR